MSDERSELPSVAESREGSERSERLVPPPIGDPLGPATAVHASGAHKIPERPDPFTAVWYRNPFVVSFIFGVLTITYLHGRLTNVPDPPPIVGTLVVEDWTDLDGQPIDATVFADSVTVVAFAGAPNGPDCGGSRLASKLWHMFRDEGVDARVATVGYGGPGDEKAWSRLESWAGGAREGWTHAGPTSEGGVLALTASLDGARPAWDEWRAENPRPPTRAQLEPPPACNGPEVLESVIIVDAQSRIRGFYPVSGWDVESEVFHRVKHVLREQEE